MKITRSELLQLRLHRSKFKTCGKYRFDEPSRELPIDAKYTHPKQIFGEKPKNKRDRRVNHAKHRN